MQCSRQHDDVSMTHLAFVIYRSHDDVFMTQPVLLFIVLTMMYP